MLASLEVRAVIELAFGQVAIHKSLSAAEERATSESHFIFALIIF